MFPFFPLIPILFIAILVGGFFWLRASAIRHGGRSPWGHYDSAESVLRERYARGEIDAEEYQARKEELKR